MNYQFGAARKLYENQAHPRVMLGPEDIFRLRRQISSGDGKKIMIVLRKKVRRLVEFVLESKDLPTMLKGDGTHHSQGAQVKYGAADLAFVAALDEGHDTLEAVHRLFAASCGVADIDRTTVVGILDMAYDLLFAHLSEPERRAYRHAAQKEIEERIKATSGNYFKSAGANTPIVTTLSAIPVLLAIKDDPGVGPLDKQLAYLLKCFEASLHTAINPNGYPEEDIGYGTAIAAWLAQIAEWLRRAGIYDVYRECPRFARFGQAILHFVQPRGADLSNTGDHGDDFGAREFVLARLAAETKDPTLLWLLGTLDYHHGKVHPENRLPEFYMEVPLRKGFRTPASCLSLLVLDELKGERHPAKTNPPTAFCERERGIVSFRSGWDERATFVVFDGSQRSPSGQGHAHASCGHFSLSALGEYFAIDTGRYNIEQNCHNIVLIDGQSGRSTEGEWTATKHHGVLTAFQPGEFVDFAAVDSSHQHNCYWARRYLGLVKGAEAPAYVWIVEDINKADAPAEYWWLLQTSPENTISVRKRSAVIKGWRHGNLLDVHFVLPAPGEYPTPHTLTIARDVGLPSSYKYIGNPKANASHYERPADMVHGPVYVRPRLLGKVRGWNGRFMSILIPRLQGAQAAVVTPLKTIANSLAVRLTFGRHRQISDTLIYAYEHNLLEADGIVGRGRWCVVRRNLETGSVIRYALGEGTSLRVAGTELDT